MKIKAINFNRIKIINQMSDREVKGLIVLVAMFTAGIIFGAGMWRTDNLNNQITTNIINEFIVTRNVSSGFSLFINSLIFNMGFLIIIIMSGCSCIGSLFVFVMPLIRGVGYGIISGYLYSNFFMNGVGYYLLTIFPAAALFNTIILLASNSACFLSLDILAIVTGRKQTDITLLRNTLKTVFIYIFILIATSIIESVTIKAFAYLFKF